MTMNVSLYKIIRIDWPNINKIIIINNLIIS